MKDFELLESGEILHSIGNFLVEGSAVIGTLTKMDGRLLQELGHALRIHRVDAKPNEFPALITNGFDPRNYSNLVILGIAHRLLGNGGVVDFRTAVNLETKSNM
ncbi:MAG: hypothetical protein EOO52_13075 [Gammaproteobacteria bacterium]|nr:MAG: hypothetical protein EOO52_13075 [Gammaproteobacteria bacterium]